MNKNIQIVTLTLSILLASCASYGPYHPNTSAEPLNSIRGPKDGRYTHTPGNNKYLVNYHVVPLGETSAPPGLRANENRAFEANIKVNHPDYRFYTSEQNDGHEDRFCHNGDL
jgi:hypothetical protein